MAFSQNKWRVGAVCLLVLSLFSSHLNGQTLYSRGASGAATTWTTTTDWSTVSHADASNCGCIPTAATTVLLGRNHTVTIPNNTAAVAASVTVSDDATGADLIIASAGTASTLTIGGALTVNSTGTVTIGGATNSSNTITAASVDVNNTSIFTINGNGNGPNTLTSTGTVTVAVGATFRTAGNGNATWAVNIAGNLVSNNIFNLTANASDMGALTFNGGAQSITGSGTALSTVNLAANGTLTFGDNANTRTITVTNDVTIGGTLQSGTTGAVAHSIQIAGSLTNNGTVNLTANGATNHTVTFANAGAEVINGASATTTLYNLIVNGPVNFGDNATARTLAIGNDLTIGAAGSLQSGATAGGAHITQVAGNLSNSGTINLTTNGATNHTIRFNGSALRTLSGAGTFTFQNFTMQTAGANDLNVNSSVSVAGVLNFAADGLLVLNSSGNVTLGSGGSITGATMARHLRLDGASGAGSQLVKTSNGTTASWQINYPVGTATGGYTPLDMSAATITTNPAVGSTLAVKAIYGADFSGHLRRTFRLVVSGNANATTMAGASFSYNGATDVSTSDVIGNYTTLWFLDTSSGSWAPIAGTITGTSPFVGPTSGEILISGTYYYTIGAPTAYQTWYSYQTGLWSDPNNWTQDPTGSSFVNPLVITPSDGDVVVILNGFTITSNVNNLNLNSTKVDGGGTLDLAATTGHTLGLVAGSGSLRINGTGLPTGTYTSFVSSSGGTIEYYNTSGTLPVSQTTYNNLLFTNSTNTAITFVTINNLTINGKLDITQTAGTGSVKWQINDGTNTSRTMALAGDLTLSANGGITVGVGNPASTTQHALSIGGSFTNNGTVQFFDPTDASFSDASYTSGAVYTTALKGNAVNVTFIGNADEILQCSSQTDLYRLILNKGSGQQAKLTLNSTAATNMRLFGPANLSSSGVSPNTVSNGALSIINGTLVLTGTLTIPILSANGAAAAGADYFSIPQNGALWINSPNVNVTMGSASAGNDDQRLLVSGLFRISSGSLSSGYGRGLGSASGGTFLVEGGTVNTWQYRPLLGGTNIFVYTQTGGVVNVGTTGYNSTPVLAGVTDFATETYARFSLPTSTSAFQMSGGVLNIGTPSLNTTTAGAQGFDVQSSASNFNVTGGTINVYIPTAGYNFGINSTAPINNLNIYQEGGALTATLNQALTVLNNLAIIAGNAPTLNCNGNNLTIGGNLDLQAGTTFTPGANTVTFNGSGAQTWTHSGTITSLNNVVVNKSANALTLGGAGTFPNIAGLTLTSGILYDNGKTITVTASVTNNATTTGTAGGPGAGGVLLNGVTTIGGNNGTFGNLRVDTNSTVLVTGDQAVAGNLRLVGANTTLNIGSNSLTVTGNIYSDAGTASNGFSNTKRILTNGLRNDRGLTRQATLGADLLFPVGTSSILYTPATILVAGGTPGTISVRPVRSAHPNANNSPTPITAQFFWRVTSLGFSGTTSVTHKSYTYSNATLSSASTDYRPARYDPTTFSWAYGTAYDATAGAGTTTIPDFNTGAGWTGIATTQLDGEYSAGLPAAFGAIVVYYSRASSVWSAAATWSLTAVGGPANAPGAPCTFCPVVIGDGGANNHTITNDANNQSCGSLFIALGSTLDCSVSTGLNFGVNTSGTGTLRIASGIFPAGDFVNFLATAGGTVDWYGATVTIPTIGSAPQSINLFNYYNLIISPNTGATITLPGTNLTIYNNLTINGTGTGAVITDGTGSRTITINASLDITAGTLRVTNNVAISTSFIVAGNTTVSNGATMAVQTTGNGTHSFFTSGSIINNGTFDFRGGAAARVVNITFTGTSDVSLTGANAGGSEFNFITVNKGTSQTPTVNFDMAGTVTTQLNNWLTLTNGTFNHNKAGGTITLTNAAPNPYIIPSSARLKVETGTVNISSVAANTSDLLLAGTVQVAGGTLNIGNGSANNNDIEYSAAGTPAIIVSSGTLYVNGAIRRPTTTIVGALVYNQTGGTVTVAGFSADNTRGVFEIENYSGSSFNMSGTAVLAIQRPTGGTAYADIYINAASTSITSTSTIQVGSNIIAGQVLDINIASPVGSLTVMGAAGFAQTGNLQANGLNLSGTLTINPASTLATNGLNVNLGGDLSIDPTATYNGSSNTTTFNGSGAQAGSLSGTSSFQNITINKPAGQVSLTGTAPTITNLNLLNGDLNNTVDLNVTGDIVNNSTQSGSGAIVFAGTSTNHSVTSSGGSFTNLTLGIAGGSAAKAITLSGNLTINGVLNFFGTNRYLIVGANQLTFSTGATTSNASSTSFIRTNGLTSDLGVVRNWPAGTTSFTYQVGAGNTYSPVTFTNLNVNAGGTGTINVIPVNQRHPTANNAQRILDCYWVVTFGSSLAFNPAGGSHTYQYPTSFLVGAGGTLSAGLLDLSNPTGWITSGHNGTVTPGAPNSTMTFTAPLGVNTPVAGNTFHYSVGTPVTLPNPIIPVYSRLDDVAGVGDPLVGGNWTNVNSWTTNSSGSGAAVASPPIGVPAVILPGARINLNANGRIAFTAVISGTLVVGTTFGHSMVSLSGTGTLRTATNTFPAGNYNAFVASTGGTIEYVAPMTMNNRSVYNNLSIHNLSAGTVIMTNTDLILNGSLTIPAGTTLNNSVNNRNISIARDWSNSGTFTPGTGTVIFNGTLAQGISGATTFNNLTISKPTNVTLSGVTTINGALNLTSGNIVSNAYPAAPRLVLSSTATLTGGGTGSFVSGQMSKVLAAASNFTFPVGSVGVSRYRPAVIGSTSALDTWTVSYLGNDPTADGFPNASFNAASMAKVSQFEYWQVAPAGAASASLTLSYNTGSYLGDIGTVSSLKIVRWNGTQWDLPPGGGTYSQSGTTTAGTVTISIETAFSPQTFASDDPASGLPITWLSFYGKRVDNSVSLHWKTAQEINNDRFEVERSIDGNKFNKIGTQKGAGNKETVSAYHFLDYDAWPNTQYYYRIRQVDFDSVYSFSTVVKISADDLASGNKWMIYPNPVDAQSFLQIQELSFPESATLSMSVIASDGRLLKRAEGSVEKLGKSLSEVIGNAFSGVFLVQLSDGASRESFRIVRK